MAPLEEAHTVKLEKFNGLNFKRWKNQMRYWLTVLGLISAIEEPNESSIGSTSSWYTPDQIEYHCLNRILSALSEHLYDVYCTTAKAKDLWNALEAEYGIDDAGIERFNASSFYKFVMIAYVLTIPKPIVDEAADEVIKQTAMKQKQKWEEDDTYCKGYILGGLSDTLYDVYEIKYVNNTAKELWDDLDIKYKTEDAGNKKFLISKLFDFRMVDSKSVITQIHELQMIMNLIISEGHSFDKSFQVSTIISKLPLAWKECRKEFKQKKDAMTMQVLVKYIQVEENSQNLDRLELEDNKSSKALVVDHGSSSGTKRKLDGQASASTNWKDKPKKACWKNRKSEDTVDEDQVHPTPEMGEGGELRRSKRARIEKTYGLDFYQFLVEGRRNEGDYSHMYKVEHDPLIYREAITSRDFDLWQEAINDEMEPIILAFPSSTSSPLSTSYLVPHRFFFGMTSSYESFPRLLFLGTPKSRILFSTTPFFGRPSGRGRLLLRVGCELLEVVVFAKSLVVVPPAAAPPPLAIALGTAEGVER
ncbi:hypothetical protein RJ639_042282 [Escallonia herrerae]|uniref:Zinc finger, CCHC-type n=1 Tax=Escallonia herrerae TaxID=1293975 RepID=A0AA88WGU3_9ASTE|nr:hypothetical protein RJ639_042282 [Escallonia herrerae]